MLKHDRLHNRLFLIILLLALVLVPGPGCSKSEEPAKTPPVEKEKPTSKVVAHVGDGTISADDLKAYIGNRSRSYHRQISLAELQKRLDKIIQDEVLYQEALRQNIDQHPDVRRRYRTMLTQKLMDEQVNRKQWNREVPEAELQAYYDQHHNKYNRPAQVRIADIFIHLPDGTTKDEKAKLQKKADNILAEAQALQGQRAGFSRLVRQYSSPHTLYGKNATGFFDIEGQPYGIDKQLTEAAFKLEKVGSISNQVIASPEGFHIIMLVGKRAALHRPLESVKNQIKRLVQRDGVEKARREFIDTLKSSTEINIDEAAVASIHTELAQTRTGKPGASRRPTPGLPQKPPSPPVK